MTIHDFSAHSEHPSARTDEEEIEARLVNAEKRLAQARTDRDQLNWRITHELLPAAQRLRRAARIFDIEFEEVDDGATPEES